MSLSDIPSKIIEKAATLSEKKMEIAFNLTQLIHKENKNEKKVFETFTHCINLIKEVHPQQEQAVDLIPPLIAPTGKKQWASPRRKLFLLALGAASSLLFITYIAFHFMGVNVLIQLLGLKNPAAG